MVCGRRARTRSSDDSRSALRAPRGLGERGRDASAAGSGKKAPRQQYPARSTGDYAGADTHLANEFSRVVKFAIRHPRLARILNLARSAPVEFRDAKDGIVEYQATVVRPAERATRAERRTRGKSRGREGSVFRASIRARTRVRGARLTSKGRRIGLGSSLRPEPSRWTTWLAREREREKTERREGDSKFGSPIPYGKSLSAPVMLCSSADRLQQRRIQATRGDSAQERGFDSRTTKKKKKIGLDDNSSGSRSQR
jgi:hypothetical protein